MKNTISALGAKRAGFQRRMNSRPGCPKSLHSAWAGKVHRNVALADSVSADTNKFDPRPLHPIVSPKKLETGLRTISAGIPYILLLRMEAMGFPTFGLLL